MKVEDLIIGDWVNLNFDADYKTGESIYAPVQVTGINKGGTIDVDCIFDNSESMQIGWDLKLIEPIELTEEILERNGFILDDSILQEKYYNGIDNRVIVHNDKEYMNSINEWYVHIDSEDYCSIASCELTYVHELQHILRLCKIDKEIVV